MEEKSLGLRKQILGISTVPIACLIFLLSYIVNEGYKNYLISANTKANLEFVSFASKMIHDIQKERGMSVSYLKGGIPFKSLGQQRISNDEKIRIMIKKLDLSHLDEKYKKSLKEMIGGIEVSRKKITLKQISSNQVVKFFSGLVRKLVHANNEAVSHTNLVFIAKNLIIQESLEELKDSLGLLRAKMTGVFLYDKALDEKSYESILLLMSSIQQSLSSFLLSSSEENLAFSHKIKKSKEWRWVLDQFNVIKKNHSGGHFGVKGADFFSSVTIVIDQFGDFLNKKNESNFISLEKKIKEIESHLVTFSVLILAFIISSIALVIYMTKKLTSSILEITSSLNDQSSSLLVMSEGITISSSDFSKNASEQASIMQETVSSINEISATVKSNADSTLKSKEVSKSSVTAAQEGKTQIEEMISVIRSIDENNKKILKHVDKSNDEISGIIQLVSEIGDKTKVINDIAFQTKLLSFNASVEAARAGEHGKGFSVVAEEIGNLASMSGNSSTEITKMLEESISNIKFIIKTNQKEMTELVSNNSDGVNKGKWVADNCGKALGIILENTKVVNSIVEEISNASREQQEGVSEINKAMLELDLSGQRNMYTAEDSSKNSIKLEGMSSDLADSIKSLLLFIKGSALDNQSSLKLLEFVWSDDCNLGIPDMDQQHLCLVDKMNNFIRSLNGKDQALIKRTFVELKEIIVSHFNNEEKFLESFGYDELEGHKKIHKALLKQVSLYYKDLLAGDISREDVVIFLKRWLASHIKTHDMKYAHVVKMRQARDMAA